MVGHIEKQDLRGADEGARSRPAAPAAAGRVRAAATADGAACRAGAARCRPARGPARGRAPPAREFGGRVEQFVERPAAAEHAVEHIGGNAACGEARCSVIAAGTRPRLSHAFAQENFSLQQRQGYAKSLAMPTDASRARPAGRQAAADAGSPTRARRSRGPACPSGGRGRQGARRNFRPRRPRSDPLRRLGNQRLNLGFLSRCSLAKARWVACLS